MKNNYISLRLCFKVIAWVVFLIMNCGLWATYVKAADVEVVLDTTGGGSGFVVKDSASVEQARINSAGVTTSKNFVSNIATGTQPYATTSTTLNTNLNADMTDGVNVASLTNTRLLRYNSTGTQIENATVTESNGALAGITTLSMSGQLTSTLATGTAPFNVSSTTLNTNLNADRWDSQDLPTLQSGMYLTNNGSTLSWGTPAGGGFTTVKKTSDQSSTSTTLGDVTGLSFSVTSGTYYFYEFYIVFRTAATTTGLRLGVTYPSATVSSYRAGIPVYRDGTGGEFQGWGTYSGDAITGTRVEAANRNYLAYVWGVILPSASGTVQLRFASEVSGSSVTIKQASWGRIMSY